MTLKEHKIESPKLKELNFKEKRFLRAEGSWLIR